MKGRLVSRPLISIDSAVVSTDVPREGAIDIKLCTKWKRAGRKILCVFFELYVFHRLRSRFLCIFTIFLVLSFLNLPKLVVFLRNITLISPKLSSIINISIST